MVLPRASCGRRPGKLACLVGGRSLPSPKNNSSLRTALVGTLLLEKRFALRTYHADICPTARQVWCLKACSNQASGMLCDSASVFWGFLVCVFRRSQSLPRAQRKERHFSALNNSILAYLYAWTFFFFKRNLGPVRWSAQNSKTTDAPTTAVRVVGWNVSRGA